MTPWEDAREANIARNKEILFEMGLAEPFFPSKVKAKPRKTQPRKRKAPTSFDDEGETPSKASKMSVEQTPVSTAGGPRRSGRNAGKTVDYKSEIRKGLPMPISVEARGATQTDARSAGKRVHDPKTFGHIPGVPVGSWWETRQACSDDAIHAPWVAGISGGPGGAYSVCLSGGYEDDVDMGYGFTFTGSGGRDLKGTKNAPKNLRTAPQSSDQSFENPFNKALKVSSETGRPVRVVRGYKLESPYAPPEGYRYDGLYKVEKAWMEPGLNRERFLVCKFALKRLPNQPPLQDEEESESQSLEVHDDNQDSEDE